MRQIVRLNDGRWALVNLNERATRSTRTRENSAPHLAYSLETGGHWWDSEHGPLLEAIDAMKHELSEVRSAREKHATSLAGLESRACIRFAADGAA